MGAYAVTVLKLRLNPTGLLITLALNAFITFGIPGISIFGHIGGLVTGALVTVALLYAPQANQARWQALGIAIIAVAIVGLLVYQGSQFASETCQFVQYREGLYYVCALAPQRAEDVQDVTGVLAELEPPEDVQLVVVFDLERDAVAAHPAVVRSRVRVWPTAAGACR